MHMYICLSLSFYLENTQTHPLFFAPSLSRCSKPSNDARAPGAGPNLPAPFTTYLSISFRESTPPQGRQLDIEISDRKYSVGDFVGQLNF